MDTLRDQRFAPFFAPKGQPHVSLKHSAATPQEAIAQQGFFPVAENRGGAARRCRFALPGAGIGLPFQPEFGLRHPQLSVRRGLQLLEFFRCQVQRGLLGLMGTGHQAVQDVD